MNDYEEIGRTKNGERIYRHKRTGRIYIEKHWSYLVESTPEEIDEVRRESYGE